MVRRAGRCLRRRALDPLLPQTLVLARRQTIEEDVIALLLRDGGLLAALSFIVELELGGFALLLVAVVDLVRESYSRPTWQVIDVGVQWATTRESSGIEVLDELAVAVEHSGHLLVGELQPHFV